MAKVFQFMSSASLEMLTGRTASNVAELEEMIATCSESSIFYHTFSALLKMREARAPYNSDFSAWVAENLHAPELAEKLTAVEFSEYRTVEDLRRRLLEIIRNYRESRSGDPLRPCYEPFYLHDVHRFVYLTDKFAYDLYSFRELLPTISIYSLYFHFIESRLSADLDCNDFSAWLEEDLELACLGGSIRKIDISVHTLEGLRQEIITLVDNHLKLLEGKSGLNGGKAV
jgi:septum formation topological specificity factor MinE